MCFYYYEKHYLFDNLMLRVYINNISPIAINWPIPLKIKINSKPNIATNFPKNNNTSAAASREKNSKKDISIPFFFKETNPAKAKRAGSAKAKKI